MQLGDVRRQVHRGENFPTDVLRLDEGDQAERGVALRAQGPADAGCTRAVASTREAYRQAGHRRCVPRVVCSPIASSTSAVRGARRPFCGVDRGEVRGIADRCSRRSRVVPTNLLAVVDGDAHKGGACISGTRRYARTARRTPTGVWCGRCGMAGGSCRRPWPTWVSWMRPGEARRRCWLGRSREVGSSGSSSRRRPHRQRR